MAGGNDSGNNRLRLRPATRADADLLLAWRNDPLTRRASRDPAPITRDDHLSWLAALLEDGRHRLLIAEERGVPVGTVRAEFTDGVYILSWTTAPQARGQGVAGRMVAQVAGDIAEPIRAEIKTGNRASVRIAEQAGMVLEREVEGMLYFRRPGAESQ